MIDAIFRESVTYFEELVYDADPAQDLHLLLASPGGDGESAVRIIRSAQARCRELTVVVPEQAKSAATVLAMGAHRILMGPTSDLGPVDPQFRVGETLVAAKDIIAAVDQAENAIQGRPETYPLHSALLSDVSGIMVQQARSAIERTDDLVEEALRSNPDRSEDEVADLQARLRQKLIDLPKSHAAVFGAADAAEAGLPVTTADPHAPQWQMIWRLWAKYFAIDAAVYEGAVASRVWRWGMGHS